VVIYSLLNKLLGLSLERSPATNSDQLFRYSQCLNHSQNLEGWWSCLFLG